jgi:hypothetical protein
MPELNRQRCFVKTSDSCDENETAALCIAVLTVTKVPGIMFGCLAVALKNPKLHLRFAPTRFHLVQVSHPA